MKQIIKIISVFILVLVCLTVPSDASLDWSSIKAQANAFITNGEGGAGYINQTETVNLISGAANILTTIGVTIVLAGILILAIQYMVATPDEAAKLKTKLVGLAVAGVVIIGAHGIWNLAYQFFKSTT